jgi:cytochrome c
MPKQISLVMAALALPLAAVSAFAGDPVHGQQVFQACAACHSTTDTTGQLGPSLKGVIGRKAGSLDSFRYSNPMMRSTIVWDDKTLAAFLRDPQATVKGTRMPFSGMAEKRDVEDVIAYLHTLN